MIDKDILFTEAMALFAERGVKMTMDELAGRMRVSKRTLYETVGSKEELAMFGVRRYFEIVEERQQPIRADDSLSATEKLRRLLTTTPVMPMSAFKLNEFRVTYPRAYALLNEKLTTGWDKTFAVMDEGVRAGELRETDKLFFAQVYAAAIEGLTMEYSAASGMGFNEMQKKLVDLLIDGLRCAPHKADQVLSGAASKMD